MQWPDVTKAQYDQTQRLMPGVRQVGIVGEPQVEILEVHRIFAPNPA